MSVYCSFWRYFQLLLFPILLIIMWSITTAVGADKSQCVVSGSTPMETPANATDSVTLTCGDEPYRNSIVYRWFDPSNQDMRNSDDQRISLEKNLLKISGVILKDHGCYTCRRFNGGPFIDVKNYLDVKYKPIWVDDSPKTVIWVKGHTGQLECLAKADPPVLFYSWYKDNELIQKEPFYTYTVQSVAKSNAGSYNCIANNLLGYTGDRLHRTVIVQDPPRFVIKPRSPSNPYVLEVGDSVSIPCSAEGESQPSIRWFKGDKLIDNSNDRITINNGELKISNAQKSDDGLYACAAVSSFVTERAPALIRINNTTPQAPENMNVDIGVFDANISWTPGFDGGHKQSFTLWFQPAGSSKWDTRPVAPPMSGFLLTRLEPETTYLFKVLPDNSLGNGTFSPVARMETLGYQAGVRTSLPFDVDGTVYYPDVSRNHGPVPFAPGNLSAGVKGNDVILAWNPPKSSSEPIFGYDVEKKKGSGNWNLAHRVVGNLTSSHTLEDIDDGDYEFRVRSYNPLALSLPSNVIALPVGDDDGMSDALIGGIVGGVIFLFLIVLLALLAVAYNKKKDKKKKQSKHDQAYVNKDNRNGKTKEPHSNGHPPSKPDRWQQNGGGDLVTSLANTDSIFFTPQSREIEDPNLSRPKYVLEPVSSYNPMWEPEPSRRVNHNKGDLSRQSTQDTEDWRRQFDPRYIPSQTETNPKGSYRENIPNPQLSQSLPYHFLADSRQNYSDQPEFYNHIPNSQTHPSVPMPKSHSFPLHQNVPQRYPRNIPYNSNQERPHSEIHSNSNPNTSIHRPINDLYPRKSNPPREMYPERQQYHLEPDISFQGHGHPDGNSGVAYPSYQSDDDVFSQIPRLNHSNQPHPHNLPRHSSMRPNIQPNELFGLEDISFVLDPTSPQSNTNFDKGPPKSFEKYPNGNIPGYYTPSGAMIRPNGRTSDNESTLSSGRPLGYSRDQLQGVVERLRQTPKQTDTSGHSEPPPSNYNPHYQPLHQRLTQSHGDLTPESTIDRRARPQNRFVPEEELDRRPRAHSEGSRDGRGQYPEDSKRNVPNYPIPAEYPIDHGNYSRPKNRTVAPEIPRRSHVFDRQDQAGPRRYEDSVSHSSGIGSRNTSQSTGSYHPSSRRGSSGKPGSASFSSYLDPDLSGDVSGVGLLPSHRRDLSGDENYEFDSINALEDDILSDLRRYSRLSESIPSNDPLNDGYPRPSKPSRYADSQKRFERLREEMQQYRKQSRLSDLPIGVDGQPLYPMDSEML